MSFLRSACLLVVAVGLAACTTGGSPTPTTGPTGGPSQAPTGQPTALPTPAATASLDPALSDAGVVGRAEVTGDGRNDHDGTYDIVGVAADGSSCEASFEGDEFIASAMNESAPEGQLRSMFVGLPSNEMPADGETSAGNSDARAGFEFNFASGVGTLYVGEPLSDDRTDVSIDVTRNGSTLTFDFEGTTWDGIEITGTLVCANAV